jgi:hypothetical protein
MSVRWYYSLPIKNEPRNRHAERVTCILIGRPVGQSCMYFVTHLLFGHLIKMNKPNFLYPLSGALDIVMFPAG